MGDLQLPPYQNRLRFLFLLHYLVERHRPLILTFVIGFYSFFHSITDIFLLTVLFKIAVNTIPINRIIAHIRKVIEVFFS